MNKERSPLKRFTIPALILSVLVGVLCIFVFTSCDPEFWEELINNIEEYSNATATPSETDTEDDGPSPSPKPEIPYLVAPEIVPYKLPEEVFPADLEKEAADITDSAIEKAISYVNAMKDGRHSEVTYGYEKDPEGRYAALSSEGKILFDEAEKAGEKFGSFRVSCSISDAFDTITALEYCRPDITSYMTFNYEGYGDDVDIVDLYFDPEGNENISAVKDGAYSMDLLHHDAGLLERVVRRIVRFMPEGLTAYDKYYYLAAVICELAEYDSSSPNRFTAYGALISGRCVCEGYTKAFILLCREADLWCGTRYGMPKGGSSHIWNVIKLDSGTYNVDITWSDGREPYSESWYEYFVKTDTDFEEDGHGATIKNICTGTFEPCPYESYN